MKPKLVTATKRSRKNQAKFRDWESIFKQIPAGLAGEFDNDTSFVRSVRGFLSRRRKASPGAFSDIYTYMDGDKFYIAREKVDS